MPFLSKQRIARPEHPLFTGDELKKLLIPLLLEQTLSVTIGMMDTVMVSSCSEASVSGVSLVDSISVLLIMVFSALATGGAVVTSQYLGKKDLQHATAAAKQLFYVVLIASLTIMGLCLALRVPLLSLLFGTIEADVMKAAQVYFLLTALSYPFLAMYNAAAALLRSEGNARASLDTSIIMNLINVSGNALFIYGFGMGVMGAGLATLISRIVGSFVIQRALYRPGCQLPPPMLYQLEWRGDLVRKILAVGIPNGLESGFFQLGKLLLLRMVSTFGTVSITANAVGNTMGTIHCLPGNAIGLAMITVVGQCVGAREYDQARYYTRRLMQLSYLCMTTLNVLILLANGIVTKPFHLSPETDALARQIVFIHGAGAATLWPLSFVLPNSLRAAGDARFTMLVSSFSMVMFRILFGYLLAMPCGMGVIGVWVAMQIDWVFRITCFVLRFRGGRWESKALV